MKFLEKNLITAVASSASHLSSSYVIANAETDVVSQPYIANATSCNITVTVASGMNSFFIFGLLADSGTVSLDDSAATSGSISINTTQYSSLGQLANNTTNRISPEWFNFTKDGASITRVDTGSVLAGCTITLALATSTDRKATQVKGNAIHQWDQSSGATGRFEDSSGAAINLIDFANVMIGSICTIGGSDYQVIKIIGDGTGVTDVTLSGSPSDATVTALKNPIKLGIVQAGVALSVENPQIGMGQIFQDYSIRRPIFDGGLSQKQRNVCKMYSISSIMSDANTQSFEGFYRAFRSKPFPAIVTHGMPAGANEDTRNSGFFYFQGPPSFEYIQNLGTISAIVFDIHEVI
jgi:hypothetical protein